MPRRPLIDEHWEAYQRLIIQGPWTDEKMVGRPGLLENFEYLQRFGLASHRNGEWKALRPTYD